MQQAFIDFFLSDLLLVKILFLKKEASKNKAQVYHNRILKGVSQIHVHNLNITW